MFLISFVKVLHKFLYGLVEGYHVLEISFELKLKILDLMVFVIWGHVCMYAILLGFQKKSVSLTLKHLIFEA